jgi:Zn-dependent protease with chaperone function
MVVTFATAFTLAVLLPFTFLRSLAMATSLFRHQVREPDAVKLTPNSAHRLFELVGEAARLATTRTVDELQLAPGAGVSVHEEGRTFAVLLGRGRRVLRLGLATVEGLTVGELKSVLCHEFGHFSNGDTRLNPLFGRVRTALDERVEAFQDLGGWSLANPSYWFFVGFRRVYLALSAGHSRRCELLADLTAAQACGSDVFSSALTAVIERGALLGDAAPRFAGRALVIGRLPGEMYTGLDRILRERPSANREALLAEAVQRGATAHDSHPAPSDRLVAVARLRAATTTDTRPATDLLPDLEPLREASTRQWLETMKKALADRNVVMDSPSKVIEDKADELVVALVELDEEFKRVRAIGDDALEKITAALARLTETLGANDIALVPLFLEASQVFLAARSGSRAIEVAEEALRIAEAQPESETKTLRALEVRSRLSALKEVERAQLAAG